jgi:molybdopterin/thiamine biosynthesis adenylyltransferase
VTALDYSRQAGAADLEVMRRSHIVQVGVGSGSELVRSFSRMGAGKITVIDPDTVEPRNVTSQGYTYAAALASVPKVVALERECNAINPEALIVPLQEDFVRMSDRRLKEILSDATLLIMATDHHPAQARGALAGLVCDVPVILASLYRRGRAGEIVYTYPGLTEACYRCITAERYEFVARERTGGTGNAAGSIPFAAAFVDAIVGHLAVGVLHKRHGAANPYADWFEKLGQRNFIQTRMAPDYKLGDEDIFGDVFGHGEKVFAFDTIWQPGVAELKHDCPDCRGRGATPVGERAHETTEMAASPGCGCLIQLGSADGGCPACSRSEAVAV